MSRLYNTLEKIRTGEPGAFSQKKSAPAKGMGQQADPSKRRRIILLGASALLALALIVFFSGPKRKDANPPLTTDAVTPARMPDHPTAPAPQLLPPVPSASSPMAPGDLYRQLNDTGVALIQENQHWRGIYYLEQARKQQPERPEALINMAVALAELGLRAPAKRLFSEAHALAPNHPLLRQNLDLLGQADFFNGQWLSSLTAGQIPPGQATKPQ
ncbi:MAG TPA: tetratricopeptide repeat protein [Desulfurivibrionaceae bacterium]